MVFSSLTFVVFFSIVCALMALTNIKKLNLAKFKHIILLLASYVFYGWWNWKCCFLMLLLTVVAYFCAFGCRGEKRKLCLTVGVVFPLIILGVFKYFNFFVDSFCAVFGIARAGTLNILLPVGISFYTFQSLSYTIDVYRGKLDAEKSFVRTALYIAFFPQLVAGPIVKAGEFIPQLHEDRNITVKGLEIGIQYFVFGLFKKLVIADNISVFVDAVYKNPAAFHGVSVMLAVAAYSIQIYCDFSGYSDMAVGCARVLGYDLNRNFNLPYLSRNMTEFWKRWHISLSTWLQEYLYIPLGGNRKGKVMTYVNLMLTMLIGGLWHGAAWTYVTWGGMNGLGLCVHKLWRTKFPNAKGNSITAGLSIAATFIFFSFSLVFFRSSNFMTAIKIFSAMFTLQQGMMFVSSWAVIGIALVTAAEITAAVKCSRKGLRWDGFYPVLDLCTIKGLTVFLIFVGITLGLAYTGDNPFIYFQF